MERLEHHDIQYKGVHCTFIIERRAVDVIVLRIEGTDVGEFGAEPMVDLGHWLADAGSVHLFIDARNVRGASMEVSGDWAKWLSQQKPKFRSVTMLTGSRFINITAEFVRRFADLEGVMRVCTEPAIFDAAVHEALTSSAR